MGRDLTSNEDYSYPECVHWLGPWMNWDGPMIIMVAMNSQAASVANLRNGRLKSPKIISLGNATANSEMASNSSARGVATQHGAGIIATLTTDSAKPN